LALLLDEGLDALIGKIASAVVWFRRPIKCQILARIVTSFTSVCNINKISMQNDCAFANLEDKYTFKFKEKQKVAA
jgi:hypothetical protein